MKKIFLWAGVVILAGLIWYLFIKPYDYLVRFEVKSSAGTANQMIKLWNNVLEPKGSLEQRSLTELNQVLKFNDSTHIYHWDISSLSDSTSLIKVYAKDLDHSINNKIAIPFSDTDFEKRTRKTLTNYLEKLKEHLDRFRITYLGETDMPAKFCAYTELETSQYGKAGGMMRDFNYISGELLKNNIELDGPPMVDITHWDKEKDSIRFHFCYPIKKTDSLPKLGDIKYKEIKSGRALKAEFNGNYIYSDRAWYGLRDLAQNQGLEVTELPLEIFYNNPNMGGDELKWKAEIYMPLKKKGE
ncbi:MAG: GyrI-like domain-containing protein [Flavobacteriaceae bacterium]